MDGTAGHIVGPIRVEHFDLGLAKSLGGVYVPARKRFELTYDTDLADIPITFDSPEPSLTDGVVPMMVILRDDISFDTPRIQRQDYEYRLPADDSTVIAYGDSTGYSKYITRKAARKCDITYTVQIYHRYRHLINKFLQLLLERLIVFEYITVVDAEGVERTYSTFLSGSALKLDELAGVTQRYMGFGLTMKVEGEINYEHEFTQDKIIRDVPTIRRTTL